MGFLSGSEKLNPTISLPNKLGRTGSLSTKKIFPFSVQFESVVCNGFVYDKYLLIHISRMMGIFGFTCQLWKRNKITQKSMVKNQRKTTIH